jgi:type I restriction enzyme S subunit
MSGNLSQRCNEKELPLPRSWVLTKVGQLYDIVGGGTPSTAVPDYWQGDIPWITSADIHGLKDIKPRRRINEKAIQNSATNLVPRGSLIVVTRVGLGKVALASTPLCFSQDSQALVGNSSLILPDYSLYYLSQAVGIFKYQHRGTTINGVTKKQLADLEFALPPLNEQRRIVAKIEELFTKLDAGVKSLETVKAQLKRYRQSVLKSAFWGKLTEEWRRIHRDELEPASKLLERIKEERRKRTGGKYKEPPPLDTSDLSALPRGWVWTRIGEVCETTSGGTPSRKIRRYFSGKIPWLKSGELEDALVRSSEECITEEGLENSSTRIVPKGTLLIALYGATVGRLGILELDSAINQAICAILTPSDLDRKFLFWYLMSYRGSLLNARKGGAQPNISQEIVKTTVVPLASLSEQSRIAEEIERHFSIADMVGKTIVGCLRQAEKLRQSILKLAFEGKLVPQDPSDEPASVLLERIESLKAQLKQDQKTRKGRKTNDCKQRRLM